MAEGLFHGCYHAGIGYGCCRYEAIVEPHLVIVKWMKSSSCSYLLSLLTGSCLDGQIGLADYSCYPYQCAAVPLKTWQIAAPRLSPVVGSCRQVVQNYP